MFFQDQHPVWGTAKNLLSFDFANDKARGPIQANELLEVGGHPSPIPAIVADDAWLLEVLAEIKTERVIIAAVLPEPDNLREVGEIRYLTGVVCIIIIVQDFYLVW